MTMTDLATTSGYTYEGGERITWVDPDGDTVVLPYLQGMSGRGLPPVQVAQVAPAVEHGTRIRTVRYGQRKVVLPLVFGTHDLGATRLDRRKLTTLLAPHRGAGRLRVETVAGDVRELVCRCVSGLELLEAQAWDQPLVLEFWSEDDPMWFDPTPVVRRFAVSANSRTFFEIPNGENNGSFITLSGADVIGADVAVTVGGDFAARPTWTFVGPADRPTVRLVADGTYAQLEALLGPGEQVVMSTPERTVTDSSGASRYGQLRGAMFDLPIGTNTMRMEAGSATADTQISLSYTERFLTV